MNGLSLGFVLLAGGLITFALRSSFIALVDHVTLGPRIRAALRYVPVAVFSAMAWPAVMSEAHEMPSAAGNLRLWAAAVAVLVAWRTRNVLYTVVAGMGTLWLMTALVGAAG